MSNTVSTVFLLLAEFGQADVPLEVVAAKYLGLSEAQARQRANTRRLPFPAYRGGESQKSRWVVRITDLADYLDAQRECAKREWSALMEARRAGRVA